MSQKKCPKCGEMNPAEAVMCWACYTPLTAGAVAAGGTAAMAATPVATAEDKEKKAVAPWQLGVVGVAVLLALGFGASQMMGGGEETDATADAGTVPKGPARPGGPPRGPSPDLSTGNVTVTLGNGGGATTSVPITTVINYDAVSPPNPALPWGVVAIVPKDANVNQTTAAGMAQFAYQQYGGKSSFKAMQIFVFKDRQAGLEFNRYQIRRKYDVLNDDDIASQLSLWPRCIVRYEVNGNAPADVRYPYLNPTGWWRGKGSR